MWIMHTCIMPVTGRLYCSNPVWPAHYRSSARTSDYGAVGFEHGRVGGRQYACLKFCRHYSSGAKYRHLRTSRVKATLNFSFERLQISIFLNYDSWTNHPVMSYNMGIAHVVHHFFSLYTFGDLRFKFIISRLKRVRLSTSSSPRRTLLAILACRKTMTSCTGGGPGILPYYNLHGRVYGFAYIRLCQTE